MQRTVYTTINKIENPALRNVAEGLARLVLENWLYILVFLLLWRFPYIVASLSDTEVTPRRPTGDSVFWQSVMAQSLLIASLSMSYNLLFGFSGIISFGHALFFGAGGYVTFVVMSQVDGISFYVAVIAAVLASILLSLVAGVVTLRLRGVYFTMFTLAFAEMFFVLAKSGTFRNITGAEDGLLIRDLIPEALNPTPTGDGSRLVMYRYTLIFFVIVFLAIRRYLNSPVGRVMLAIRENEERARTIGYNTFRYKLITMVFAGVIACLTGILFVLWSTDKRIKPDLLSLNYTVQPLLYTLIGGVGTLAGPVISSLGLELGEAYLRDETLRIGSATYEIADLWDLFLGVLFVVVVMVLPNGIVGTWNRWWAGRKVKRLEASMQMQQKPPDSAS